MCLQYSEDRYEHESIGRNDASCILKSLDSFVYSMRERGYYIIPIARRGIRVLELSRYSEELFKEGRIIFYDAIKFYTHKLRNKKMVLFDEGVYSGLSLFRHRTELEELFHNKLKSNNKIITASLVVNKDKVNIFPDDYQLVVRSDHYDHISQELDYKILSNGKPMDVDHLICRVGFKDNSNLDNIRDILVDVFHAIVLDEFDHYSGIKMFTIDGNIEETKSALDFEIRDIAGLPKIFNGGVKKIRLYIKDNIMHIIPVVYPAVEISNTLPHMDTCPLKDILAGASLCNIMSEATQNSDELQTIRCYNCIIEAINLSILSEFLLILKKYIKFEYIGFEDKFNPLIFAEKNGEFASILDEEISKYLDANKKLVVGETLAESFETPNVTINYIDPEINELIRLSPYNAIVEAIIKNPEMNKPNLVTKDEELLGLTYSQIFECFGGKEKYEDFSRGMDIALDTGSLKPVTPYKGLYITSNEKQYRAIVRLYKLTGEETKYSMLSFLNFIGRI
jgi:hypothetical protein